MDVSVFFRSMSLRRFKCIVPVCWLRLYSDCDLKCSSATFATHAC